MHTGKLTQMALFLSLYKLLFIIFIFFSKIINNDDQKEEYGMSFHTFIFVEENNERLKKNDIKRKDNFGFVVLLKER